MQKSDFMERREISFGPLNKASSSTRLILPPGPASISSSAIPSSSQPAPGWLCNPSVVRTSSPVDTAGSFHATNPDTHGRNWPQRLKEWLSALTGCK
jgi:hypothetical protein